eukprot:844194-Alexandrium_andersonii.AAC.1
MVSRPPPGLERPPRDGRVRGSGREGALPAARRQERRGASQGSARTEGLPRREAPAQPPTDPGRGRCSPCHGPPCLAPPASALLILTQKE